MPLHANLTEYIREQVRVALNEDIGSGDLTAQLIAENTPGRATVIARQSAVICGTQWFDACFKHLDPDCSIRWQIQDGETVDANRTLCEIQGNARGMLTAERCALNFLQTLSATATATRRYVDAVTGTKAKIMDTRKTLPGLRIAQKYAVTTGGGYNQRIALYDGILIKENHIHAAGGIAQVLQQARALAPAGVSIQIEVETLDQLRAALDCGATLILLDNFDLAEMREAVAITAGQAELEASGSVNLDTVRAIAETGVDRISIGTLTKDIQAVDLSMRFS
jgi:nicotinate-nucleotide pyrophosphorylase (carboxylating)